MVDWNILNTNKDTQLIIEKQEHTTMKAEYTIQYNVM